MVGFWCSRKCVMNKVIVKIAGLEIYCSVLLRFGDFFLQALPETKQNLKKKLPNIFLQFNLLISDYCISVAPQIPFSLRTQGLNTELLLSFNWHSEMLAKELHLIHKIKWRKIPTSYVLRY